MQSSKLVETEAGIEFDLMPGKLYLLALPDNAFGNALMLDALQHAVQAQRPVWLIGRADAAHDWHDASHPVRQARATGAITVLEMRSSGRGVRPMLRELSHFGVARALLVFDGAERLFQAAPQDERTLRHWRNFAEEGECTVVFILRAQDGMALADVGPLLPVSQLFGGIGRVRTNDGAPLFDIFHWFAQGGVQAGARLRLAEGGNAWGVQGSTETVAAQGLAPASDVDQVLCMQSLSSQATALPAHWHVHKDLAAVLQASMGAIAATVVLCFDLDTVFTDLARAIYSLRKRCGDRLKIVVREHDRQRYSQESLLIQLGATLLVPPEVGHSRFLTMVSLVQGQVFSRVLPSDLGQAITSSFGELHKGYLPPPMFVQVTQKALDNGEKLGVQSILVRMPFGGGLTARDTLMHCSAKRPGDLVTADLKFVYVFLFACREGDADLAIERLFKLSVRDLFDGQDRFFSRSSILGQLDALDLQAASLPDLSEVLSTQILRNDPTPAHTGALDAERRSAGQTRSSQFHHRRHSDPLPAQPHPLVLRDADISDEEDMMIFILV